MTEKNFPEGLHRLEDSSSLLDSLKTVISTLKEGSEDQKRILKIYKEQLAIQKSLISLEKKKDSIIKETLDYGSTPRELVIAVEDIQNIIYSTEDTLKFGIKEILDELRSLQLETETKDFEQEFLEELSEIVSNTEPKTVAKASKESFSSPEFLSAFNSDVSLESIMGNPYTSTTEDSFLEEKVRPNKDTLLKSGIIGASTVYLSEELKESFGESIPKIGENLGSNVDDMFKFGILSKLGGKALNFVPTLGLAGSILWGVVDAIKSSGQAENWGVSSFSAVVGGVLGGQGEGFTGAVTNAGKGLLLGAGIGAKFGPVGLLTGSLVGASLFGIAGYFGSEEIAKGTERIKDWIATKGTIDSLIPGAATGFTAGALVASIGGPVGLIAGGLIGASVGALASFFFPEGIQKGISGITQWVLTGGLKDSLPSLAVGASVGMTAGAIGGPVGMVAGGLLGASLGALASFFLKEPVTQGITSIKNWIADNGFRDLLSSTFTGVALGASIGLVGGPVGALIGGLVGGAIGGAVEIIGPENITEFLRKKLNHFKEDLFLTFDNIGLVVGDYVWSILPPWVQRALQGLGVDRELTTAFTDSKFKDIHETIAKSGQYGSVASNYLTEKGKQSALTRGESLGGSFSLPNTSGASAVGIAYTRASDPTYSDFSTATDAQTNRTNKLIGLLKNLSTTDNNTNSYFDRVAKYKPIDDAIIYKDGQLYKPHENDQIIATKNPISVNNEVLKSKSKGVSNLEKEIDSSYFLKKENNEESLKRFDTMITLLQSINTSMGKKNPILVSEVSSGSSFSFNQLRSGGSK
jgi:hypothetical protein